jgi:hypothetical protein
MSKDKNKHHQQAPQPLKQKPQLIGISKRGRTIIAAGIGVLILGFFILSKTDPAGQNWASILSPFLILGGYAIIGIGIIVPDKNEHVFPATTPPPPPGQKNN